MMDNNGFGERDSATPAGWSAPTPPAPSIAEPVLSGHYGQSSPPAAPPAPSSSKLPWFAAVTGALVLLVGGGFFALTAFAASGGADSPEAAVDAMIEAANSEDFITIAELLEPSERRTIAEPIITEVLPELIRLGVLDDSADAGGVEGVDFELTDVTYQVSPIAGHADMVHVYFTGGQAASEFNSADFPLGAEFRERFGDDIEDEPLTTEDMADAETPIVLVERDGRWYMSAMFTIAENARLEAGEEIPSLAAVPVALGSASPEAAVEAMVGELVELDMAGMIGRMDPEEMAVLYRYAPLFLEEGQDGLDEFSGFLDDNNVQWDVTQFDFDVETDGDDASVTFRGFQFELTSDDVDVTFTWARDRLAGSVDAADLGRGSFEATPTRWVIEGEIEGETVDIEILIDPEATTISGEGAAAGETFSGELDFDETGTCSRYRVSASDGTEESGCVEEDLGEGGGFVIQQYIGLFDDLTDEFTGPTIAARRTNGEWYISPVSTVLDSYISSLQELEEGEFERMLDSLGAASVVGFGALGSVDDLTGGDDVMFDDSAFEDAMTQDEIDELFADSDDDFGDALNEDGSVDFGSAATLGSSSLTTLAPGAGSITLQGTLASNTFDELLIDLAAGDVVTVSVSAADGSELDTTVEVFGPDGWSLGYNDDADSSAGLGLFDSQAEVTAQSDGTHRIEVRSFGDFGEGAYEVMLTRS